MSSPARLPARPAACRVTAYNAAWPAAPCGPSGHLHHQARHHDAPLWFPHAFTMKGARTDKNPTAACRLLCYTAALRCACQGASGPRFPVSTHSRQSRKRRANRSHERNHPFIAGLNVCMIVPSCGAVLGGAAQVFAQLLR